MDFDSFSFEFSDAAEEPSVKMPLNGSQSTGEHITSFSLEHPNTSSNSVVSDTTHHPILSSTSFPHVSTVDIPMESESSVPSASFGLNLLRSFGLKNVPDDISDSEPRKRRSFGRFGLGFASSQSSVPEFSQWELLGFTGIRVGNTIRTKLGTGQITRILDDVIEISLEDGRLVKIGADDIVK
ncbi:hypothetical protein GEMRC1_011515 [Eukaryota sp. GEM-RC1]